VNREFLGDSYDAVKRLWRDVLAPFAPLYAAVRFIPDELRQQFTLLTRIPMLDEPPVGRFSILNDPDTGVKLAGKGRNSRAAAHISIQEILEQLKSDRLQCVITFDQSYKRSKEHPHRAQRQAKLHLLQDGGAFAFYYVSHAPFLFAFPDVRTLENVRKLLIDAGVPESRIEICF